jgi:hypothetical protein
VQTTLQVPPSLDFDRRSFTLNSDLKQGGAISAQVPGARVLLVCQELFCSVSPLRALEKFGCEFSFALHSRVTSEYVRTGEYTIVLIDSTVPSGFRRDLVSGLIGSDAFIFYAYPVESGCWWVPALLSGRDSHGSPAFRTNQILAELQNVLRARIASHLSMGI